MSHTPEHAESQLATHAESRAGEYSHGDDAEYAKGGWHTGTHSDPPCGPMAGHDAPQGPACYGSGAAARQAAESVQRELGPPECIGREWKLLDEALGLTGGSAGTAQTLFTPLKWASVEKANTLMKAKALPAVKALTKIFADAGFAPSVNFNVGSGELSLTLPLFAKDEVAGSAAHVVVQTMLGTMPEQLSLEEYYAAVCKRCAPGAAADTHGEASVDLLANRCIDSFAKQTGVGIWQRVVDVRTKTMKLSFAAYDDLFGGPRKMIKYSACYSALAGFRDTASHRALRTGTSEDLKGALDTAREQLIASMASHFWAAVASFPYVATASLRDTLGEELRRYLAAGLSDATGGFVPPSDARLSFFLYGGAGTGKTTMVSAFAKALQATLRHFVDAGMRSDIVKVPLNGLTPESLGMILRVQGISDMSIERLLEQTVSKGGIAILHLEEIPEDPALQEALVSTVNGMLAVLLRRYHMYAGNVILAYTSNYPAAPAVAGTTTEITVVAPSAQEQWRHCVGMLEAGVRGLTGAALVEVELKYKLVLLADMRPLCQWWTTLSYHIARRVKDYVAAHGADCADSAPQRVVAVLSSANSGGMITIDLRVELAPGATERDRQSLAESDGVSCASCGSRRAGVSGTALAITKEQTRLSTGNMNGVEENLDDGNSNHVEGVGGLGEKEEEEEEEEEEEPCAWGGWGVLSRGAQRRKKGRGPVRAFLKRLSDALLIDDDTTGPSGPTLPPFLPTPVCAPASAEARGLVRCAPACKACAYVGNIWTYVDCQGNPRDPYIPRPCSQEAIGGGAADGDGEHVQSPELPALHSRNASVDEGVLAALAAAAAEEEEEKEAVGDEAVGVVGAGTEKANKANRPLLTVCSMDGFFFVEGDGTGWNDMGVGGGGAGRSASSEADKFRRRRNSTIVNMTLTSVLKPGVVVLMGEDAERAQVECGIIEQAVSCAGEGRTHVVHVDLREEKDKDKVNGHQSQIRGGLFKVIDDFNNPNSAAASEEGLLVIVCHVNANGQYMLRELLETNGESRTHRFAIRKDRVLFILSVDEGAGLQEMTVSRAHALIHC